MFNLVNADNFKSYATLEKKFNNLFDKIGSMGNFSILLILGLVTTYELCAVIFSFGIPGLSLNLLFLGGLGMVTYEFTRLVFGVFVGNPLIHMRLERGGEDFLLHTMAGFGKEYNENHDFR